jgi:hypothetical protein
MASQAGRSRWGVAHWPSRWYGRDLPVGLVPVVEEEFERVGAIGVAKVGIRTLAAETILAHGTDWQKEKFLLRIFSIRTRMSTCRRPVALRQDSLFDCSTPITAGQSICTSAGSREQRLIWRIGFFVSSARSGCCSSAANGCNEFASRAAASNERLFAGQQLIPKVRGSRCRYVDGRKARATPRHRRRSRSASNNADVANKAVPEPTPARKRRPRSRVASGASPS